MSTGASTMSDEEDEALAAWVQQRMLSTGIYVRLLDIEGVSHGEGDISNGGDVTAYGLPEGVEIVAIVVTSGDTLLYRGPVEGLPCAGNGGDVVLKGEAIARDARRVIEQGLAARRAQELQSLQALHASGVLSTRTILEQLGFEVELEGEGEIAAVAPLSNSFRKDKKSNV